MKLDVETNQDEEEMACRIMESFWCSWREETKTSNWTLQAQLNVALLALLLIQAGWANMHNDLLLGDNEAPRGKQDSGVDW